MKTWVKALLITLIFGIPAYLLNPVLWPPSIDINVTPSQLPFYKLLAVTEALAFGAGFAFIILGWPWIRKTSFKNRNRAILLYFSISWLLVSWWPHDNLHLHIGLDSLGFLLVEYEFHVTLMVVGVIAAYCFYGLLKDKKM
ncbi:hypothetical protein HYU09_02475 [Candidatus Woesearchaeota archaeon]|nr:hypothetical protein [Candidatus Woesearchaeota archaeon]